MKPFHQYTGIFGVEVNGDIYSLATSKKAHFSQSKTSISKHYPQWRRSAVIYDNQFSALKLKLEQEVIARLPEVSEILDIEKFEVEYLEIQLTSHNDGEYYKWHTDNNTFDTTNRAITFVYYFNAIPRKFSGGELVIYHDHQEYIIEPLNDSMIFFRSEIRHEVKPVICPSRLFEEGRFTLNGWVRRRRNRWLDDKYFGYNMFKLANLKRGNGISQQ